MGLKRILVVDDEADMVDLLAKRLENEAYEAIKCTSGYDAVEKAKMFVPDLVLMDILLPDMDGAEVVKIFQRTPDIKDIPVIFLSGIITEKDGATEHVTVGDYEYEAIGKPFNFSELLEMIKKTI